jgi:hypothetical protein
MRIDGFVMNKGWLMNRSLYGWQAIEEPAELMFAGCQLRALS